MHFRSVIPFASPVVQDTQDYESCRVLIRDPAQVLPSLVVAIPRPTSGSGDARYEISEVNSVYDALLRWHMV